MSAIALIKTAAISSARIATVQKAAPAFSWTVLSRRAYATDNGEKVTEEPKQATPEESTEKKVDAGKTAEELTTALAEKEKKLAEIQVCNNVIGDRNCGEGEHGDVKNRGKMPLGSKPVRHC